MNTNNRYAQSNLIGGGYPGINGGLPINAGTAGSSDAELAKGVYRRGLEGPFGQAQRQSLINQQAGMAATAEGVQQEQLRSSAASRGMAFTDPGYQAASRGLTADRQASTIDAAGDIGRQAIQANFTGGLQAADRLMQSTQPSFGAGSVTHNGGGYSGLAFSQPKTAYTSSYIKPKSTISAFMSQVPG